MHSQVCGAPHSTSTMTEDALTVRADGARLTVREAMGSKAAVVTQRLTQIDRFRVARCNALCRDVSDSVASTRACVTQPKSFLQSTGGDGCERE